MYYFFVFGEELTIFAHETNYMKLVMKVFCPLASSVHSVVPLPLHLLAEYLFIGLAYYKGKDIVFRFIIEYSSLRDFGP